MNVTCGKERLMRKVDVMEKIRRISHSELLCALCLNVVFLIGVSYIFGIHFETNDDVGMAGIVAGVTGVPSARTVFINVILGKIIKTVTSMCGGYNWYTIAQVGGIFVSLCVVTYMLLKRHQKDGFPCSIFILMYFGYEMYVNLQFTKTAGVATVAGTLLIAYTLEYQQHIICYILGTVLLVIGSLYRFDACGLALIFLSYIGFSYIYRWHKDCREKRKIVNYFLGWGGVLLVVISAKFLDIHAYNSLAEYNEFREYNELRAELLDHGFPDYYENQELYETLNISESDLKLFKKWNFADPDVFNVDSMKKMVEAKPAKTVNVSLIKDFIYQIFHGNILEHGYIIYIVLIVVVLLLDEMSYKLVIWNCVLYGGIEFYFYYTDRYLLHRVETVMWLTQSLLLLYCCEWRPKMKKKLQYYIGIILVVLLINGNLYVDKYKENRVDRLYYREILEEISRDKEHLYVLGTLDDLVSKSYDAQDTIPYGVRSNNTLLGGWGTELPTENAVLNRYGVQNIYRDVVNNPNIYIAGFGDVQDILGYIQRHYCADAQLVWVRNVGTLSVYHVIGTQ